MNFPEWTKEIPDMEDSVLIALWRHFAISLEQLKILGVPTEVTPAIVGSLVRELDSRGIVYDDPRGDVWDRNGRLHLHQP